MALAAVEDASEGVVGDVALGKAASEILRPRLQIAGAGPPDSVVAGAHELTALRIELSRGQQA